MHHIRDCQEGTSFLCDLAGEAWTGNLVTIDILGVLIKSSRENHVRVVRRRCGRGGREAVKIYPRKATHLCL